MAYANNRGVRIHFEVEGEGPPLLLLHGLGGTLGVWRDRGYTEVLKLKYTLVLVDARGHGESDKPHDIEAYEAKLWASDVVAVLDEAGIGTAHYFGYSMGGAIGFALATYVPERFHSLILGGSSPYRGEAEVEAMDLIRRRLEAGAEAGIAYREQSLGRPLTQEEKSRLLATDYQALLASLQTVRLSNFVDVLPTMSMPCLLFAGDADPRCAGAKEATAQMPNATFVTLPGLDHSQGLARSDIVLPHVTKFLAEVEKGYEAPGPETV